MTQKKAPNCKIVNVYVAGKPYFACSQFTICQWELSYDMTIKMTGIYGGGKRYVLSFNLFLLGNILFKTSINRKS